MVLFSCSVMSDSLHPIDWSTPGFTVHDQLPELAQSHVNWVSHAIQTSRLLLSPYPLAFNLSSIKAFSNESVLYIRYWSFIFSTSHSKEYSILISIRMDWLDPLAVQGILKSLLQHHSSKVLILQCSAFFMVQLSHPYIITGKTIALLDGPLLAK